MAKPGEMKPDAVRRNGTRVEMKLDPDLAESMKRAARIEGLSLTGWIVAVVETALKASQPQKRARRTARLPHVA
jgi:uncharacterized protein (DUF1778 family)